MRWTQDAGAEIKSVFLCNTKIAAATADDLLALKKIQYDILTRPILLYNDYDKT